MERIDLGQPFTVIVDYAHSPASLETVLDLLAPVAAAGGGGLIVVFGSAGERDTEKRPMMGRIAGERCRLVVITDEDPRGEDRQAILEAIARGAEVGRPATEPRPAPDRRPRAALSRPPSSRPGPATSSCSPARATSARSSAPTARSPGTSGPRSNAPSRPWVSRRADSSASVPRSSAPGSRSSARPPRRRSGRRHSARPPRPSPRPPGTRPRPGRQIVRSFIRQRLGTQLDRGRELANESSIEPCEMAKYQLLEFRIRPARQCLRCDQ